MQSLLYGRAKRGATIKTHVRTQESFSTIHRKLWKTWMTKIINNVCEKVMWRIVNNSKSLTIIDIFLTFFMWITMLEIRFSTRNYS